MKVIPDFWGLLYEQSVYGFGSAFVIPDWLPVSKLRPAILVGGIKQKTSQQLQFGNNDPFTAEILY